MSQDEGTTRHVVTGGLRRLAGVRELEERVAALEAEVQEYRRTHLRYAELLDLVQELLLPVAQQDRAKVEAAIARYTDELSSQDSRDQA